MTKQDRSNEHIDEIIREEASYAPTAEARLDAIHGAAQALWHVAKEVGEPMDKQALMFIHEGLLENIVALKAALYRTEMPVGNVFMISCPASYRDEPTTGSEPKAA